MKHVLTAFLSAALCLNAISADNIFPNGNFEQFDGNLPVNWHGSSWNNDYCKATWNSVSPGRNGTGKAFRINTSNYMTAMNFAAPAIRVKGGTTYLFKGHYRFAGERFDINGQILDDKGNVVSTWTQRLPSTQNEWIAFFDEIKIPAAGSSIIFDLNKKQTGEFLEIDDFSLREGCFYDYASEFVPQISKPDETFPIFCWVPPYDYVSFGQSREIYKNPRAYAEYAYANNTVWGDTRFGQKRIVYANEVTPELNTKSDTVYTIHGGDEPSTDQFPSLVKQRDELKAIAPNLNYSNNLLPVYGFKDFTVYEKYLENYFSQLKPKIATYDHYAFPSNDHNYIWKDYFPNLALFRKVAKKHDADYGIIVQLIGFGGCRPATEGDMNFQAYTALAFGCKALGWFTFFEPIGEYDNWNDATINTKGNRTYHYSMMRRINAEILALGKTLLKLNNIGVYFNRDVPEFCQSLHEATLLEGINNGDALVGEFVNPKTKQKYVMIVNRSFTKSAKLGVVFKSEVKSIIQISPITGELEKPQAIERGWFNLSDGEVEIDLGPGQGKLYLINK